MVGSGVCFLYRIIVCHVRLYILCSVVSKVRCGVGKILPKMMGMDTFEIGKSGFESAIRYRGTYGMVNLRNIHDGLR